MLAPVAFATPQITWTNTGGDNIASNPANWSGNILPQSGDIAIFDGTSTDNCTWNYIATLDSLSINSNYSGTLTIDAALSTTGNVDILGGNIIINNGTLIIGATGPSDLTATPISSIWIDLSWTDNSDNETGFKIERKIGAGSSYSQIAVVGADITSYSDTGLTPETTYYYKVRA